MHFRQKLIFIALGSALTLAGYLLATLVSDVTAQNNPTKSLGDVVCDSITVRDGGITILKEGRIRSMIDSNMMHFTDKSGNPRVAMGYFNPEVYGTHQFINSDISDTGGFYIYSEEGQIRANIDEDRIRLFDKSGNARVVMVYFEKTDIASIHVLDKSANDRARIGYIGEIDSAWVQTVNKNGEITGYIHKH
jgi:uncharacterized protein YdeI (BOF family)